MSAWCQNATGGIEYVIGRTGELPRAVPVVSLCLFVYLRLFSSSIVTTE